MKATLYGLAACCCDVCRCILRRTPKEAPFKVARFYKIWMKKQAEVVSMSYHLTIIPCQTVISSLNASKY